MRDLTFQSARRLGVAAIMVLAVSACSSGQSDNASGNRPGASTAGATNATGPVQVGADGVTNVPAGSLQPQLDALPKATLTTQEQAGLLWMREEEKLARDVYATLYAKWNTPIFANIAGAEQTHTDAVKALLDRYGLADPAAGTAAGTFTNPGIQVLYTTLVGQGSTSLATALTAGATIKDLDIADLQARATTTPDIALVYANLEKGSRNHLRAFVKQLTANGARYAPTHITQSAYDAIVSTDTERGATG